MDMLIGWGEKEDYKAVADNIVSKTQIFSKYGIPKNSISTIVNEL